MTISIAVPSTGKLGVGCLEETSNMDGYNIKFLNDNVCDEILIMEIQICLKRATARFRIVSFFFFFS